MTVLTSFAQKVWSRPGVAAAAATLGVGLAAIIAAWGFQLIGGYVPCKLCLQERIFYYVGLPFALAALVLFTRGQGRRLALAFLAISGLSFLGGTALGIYHSGAEWAWWPGPSDCGGGSGPVTSAAELLEALAHTVIVKCTEAAWRFPNFAWGLSFAGWNAAVSAFCSAASFAGVGLAARQGAAR
ncbi:MAG: disulfide bond formation protein B [Bauldia sp.]